MCIVVSQKNTSSCVKLELVFIVRFETRVAGTSKWFKDIVVWFFLVNQEVWTLIVNDW